MQLNPHIFRAYDIRGVADTDLTDEVAVALGRAFGTYLRRKGESQAIIGRDHRHSSGRIFAALAKGVLAAGVDVVDVGLVSSPTLYFARYHLGIPSEVMITGSHLPPDENGFKFIVDHEVCTEKQTSVMRGFIDAEDFEQGEGRISSAEVNQAYIEKVASLTKLTRPLTVVVDSGNGMGGLTAPAIFRAIGANVIELFSDLDPSFPNHFPDPTIPSNMKQLQAKVLETGADLGVAFDADADRVGVVDPAGRLIYGDMMIALFFREVASRHQGEPVIVEVKCSQAAYEDVEAHGGKPLLWKTGHAFIELKMHETKAIVAGGMSGHMYFGDEYYPYDDGPYTAARMARLLSKSELPLDQLVDELPRYEATPELRVHCADDRKVAVVEAVVRELGARYPGSFTLDGIRMNLPHGWALVRYSNTQPRIIVRSEGKTPEQRDEYLRIARDELAKHEGVDISALDQCLAGEEITSH